MENCTEKTSDKIIVISDPKGRSNSKMRFLNDNQRIVSKITVDGCVEVPGKKCDFLLIDHNGTEHFIELKGKKIEDAVMQIKNSMKHISKNKKSQKFSFIICSRVPTEARTDIQGWKSEFIIDYNSILIIHNKQYTHTIK
jgi:hypothetical protein